MNRKSAIVQAITTKFRARDFRSHRSIHEKRLETEVLALYSTQEAQPTRLRSTHTYTRCSQYRPLQSSNKINRQKLTSSKHKASRSRLARPKPTKWPLAQLISLTCWSQIWTMQSNVTKPCRSAAPLSLSLWARHSATTAETSKNLMYQSSTLQLQEPLPYPKLKANQGKQSHQFATKITGTSLLTSICSQPITIKRHWGSGMCASTQSITLTQRGNWLRT